MTAPTLEVRTGFAVKASPFGRRGAPRREFPTSPPAGALASFGTARQET